MYRSGRTSKRLLPRIVRNLSSRIGHVCSAVGRARSPVGSSRDAGDKRSERS